MFRLIGCLGRLFALILLLGLVFLAWTRGPELWRAVRGGEEEEAPTSVEAREELANEALTRYRRAVEGDSGSVSFSDDEVEAILLHRFADRIPRGGVRPTVRFSSGEVAIGARFPRDSIPLPEDLERGRRVLPTEVPVVLHGTLLSADGGPIFVVRRVDVAGLPVPRTVSDRVLRYLGAGEDGALPASALPIPLPPEARGVYIDGDRLLLRNLP